MQALRRQQQAQLRNLREQQKAQRQWSNNFNNSNRGWGWGWGNNLDWRQRRIQQLRSEIGSTMHLGKRAAMQRELMQLQGRL
jgi:hypothetical protein